MGIVFSELVARALRGYYVAPYGEEQFEHGVQLMAQVAMSEDFRPSIPENCPVLVKEMIQSCWAGNPEKRPSVMDLLGTVKIIRKQYKTHREQWDPLLSSSPSLSSSSSSSITTTTSSSTAFPVAVAATTSSSSSLSSSSSSSSASSVSSSTASSCIRPTMTTTTTTTTTTTMSANSNKVPHFLLFNFVQ
eukprot:TRINITY_DN1436_c0_g1_i2.p2 TRINITY_DN1436_c0_g1~~TRINITY_DN1436_c0_g1_i2.p2  ORF type:complete len:190 (-),score=51.60 TRINITY_DN1436_c0_g1_i2:11-580(-)